MNTSSTVKLPPPNWKLILHTKVPLDAATLVYGLAPILETLGLKVTRS